MRFLRRRPADVQEDTQVDELRLEAERGRALVEASPELVVVLDEQERVVAASRRAREALDGLVEGQQLPERARRSPVARVPVEVDGRRETLVYLDRPGQLAAYEELRAGFTAAVSHELRTPLARLLALLETALLPGQDADELIAQARAQVEHIGELIDEVLFLSELETGRTVVALAATRALPVVEEVLRELDEPAERAAVAVRAEGDPTAELPLRPRMLRVVVENLARNAIRYAGPGSTFTVTVTPGSLTAVDDGAGVSEEDLPRLFERFYRADRARASRGTGLGLAIVKHIVTAADGFVSAEGGPGNGLRITCTFASPPRSPDRHHSFT